jgi:Sec-independent protein secretion pathway component TatC
MCIICLVMLKAEWKTRFRWVPIVVLLAIVGASSITYFLIFPVNHEMAARITDPQQLSIAIGKWVQYTWYRVVLWSLEWVTMMYYFAARAYQTLERS